MPIDEIAFAVSCSATVSDEFELQLTKTDDKARNWTTMFQNWSTKDEIETSNRTFQSVRDETENTFSKIEWRGDENGRENLYYYLVKLAQLKRGGLVGSWKLKWKQLYMLQHNCWCNVNIFQLKDFSSIHCNIFFIPLNSQ